ncbi:mitofilin family membrane protein [Mesorhizobium sp. M1338]|uniref:COG4223 family protein n=1 Tax=unclassified Mesorhizobium TaxID=325217 RepID=UPI00333BFB40
MVKTPKVRHSKSRREPVTIDLEPGAVSRVADEGAARAQTDEAKAEEAENASQAELPEEPVHADQTDLEPWEHADAKAESEQPVAAGKGGSEAELPYPGSSDDPGSSDVPADKTKAYDYNFEDASAKPPRTGGDKAKTETRDERTAPPPAKRGGFNGIAAGLLGGVIALVGAGGLQFAGLLGAPGSGSSVSLEGVNGEIASLKSEIAGLKEAGGNSDAAAKVVGLSSGLEQVKADVAALKSAVEKGGAGDTAGLAALGDKIKQIETAVAALGKTGGTAPVDLGPLNEKLAGLDAQVKSAGEATTAQDGRLTALEQSVSQLAGKVEAAAGQPKIALAIAASALKAALDRGAPFSAELETFAAISPDAPQLATLRPYAEKGVPTRAEIASQADAAANDMVGAATPVDESAGFLQNLLSSAESLVKVRPIGAVEGAGVPEIVARMEAAVKQGDYVKALTEYDTLPQAAKAAGADFAGKLKARVEIETQVDALISGAMKA